MRDFPPAIIWNSQVINSPNNEKNHEDYAVIEQRNVCVCT